MYYWLFSDEDEILYKLESYEDLKTKGIQLPGIIEYYFKACLEMPISFDGWELHFCFNCPVNKKFYNKRKLPKRRRPLTTTLDTDYSFTYPDHWWKIW